MTYLKFEKVENQKLICLFNLVSDKDKNLIMKVLQCKCSL